MDGLFIFFKVSSDSKVPHFSSSPSFSEFTTDQVDPDSHYTMELYVSFL